MEHPNGPLVTSHKFYAQLQGLENFHRVVIGILERKTKCKYIYTLNLLLFIYIYKNIYRENAYISERCSVEMWFLR